ncbi:unnamed protein product [Mytilus edulis]|uniref:MULE transposase domain-containing protein n=1 Tax=Mytilus edulis TaxID=6550 RepID=A0A8S3RF24_MYTED|nr:unnamed protein product [Mytilus edulis]
MDGTFKFCPKFFKQLYTIHGFKNGNYIPLVFILLTGKSEEIYHHGFTNLVEVCDDRNLTLKPKMVHVDFEDRVMVVVRNLFPSALLKCCRFHLSQAWWRKILALGLSKEYKECTTEVGKWLRKFFGLSFLPDSDVEDSFVEDMMAEAPKEPKCSKGVGSTIIEQQSVNYIKIRYIDEQAPQSRIEKEKLDHLFEMWAKYQSGQITRAKFVHSLGFKYQAKTDL